MGRLSNRSASAMPSIAPISQRPVEVAPVKPEDDEIERIGGRNIIAGVALTAVALVAGALVAAILALEYADAERDRELRRWQDRLGLIADTRTGAVEGWLRNQFDALGALADNASVQLYMSELTTKREPAERLTQDLARSGYLRNLLTVLADREGFAAAPTGPDVDANVRRLGVAGLALLDSTGRAVAATAGMPAIEGGLQGFVTGAERGSSALLDMHIGPSGRPAMAFLAPVFAVHGDRSPTRQVGWALGVKQVGRELFQLLRQPGAPWASAEALLVRRDGAAIGYLSPTAGGQDALTRRLAFDTPELAAAYAIDHPGGFSRKLDYRGTSVLVAARAVARAPWSLLYKLDSAEALGPGEARLRSFLVTLALAVVVVIAAFVAVWRHGASRRAGAAASRHEALFRRHEAQSRFLRLISDSQPEPMFILDADGRYTFANRAAGERAGISPEDMLGKTVDSVLGPVAGQRIRARNRIAETPETVLEEFRDSDPNGALRVVQSAHVPVPETPDSGPGVMVVERDITVAVAERERRVRLLDRLIQTLLTIVDRRDPYAANHSARVAAVARGIAEEMGLDPTTVDTAETAGSLMNLGKILVPPDLLCSTDDLQSFELRMIRESVRATADLLEDVEFDGPVVEVLRQVRERWDGAGEPDGRGGDDILLPARVVSAANAFVAMISPRAWRPGMSVDEAIDRLMAEIGGAFDRRVVAALINRLDNRGARGVWADGRSTAA